MRNPQVVAGVFLDTEVFVESNFAFDSARLKAISEDAAHGRFRLLSSDLTLREIRANILEHLSAAANAKPSPILRNFTSPEVLSRIKELDVHALSEELGSKLDSYLRRSRAVVLQIRPEDLNSVLDDYFSRKPPFGRGKNKAEFPDAFVLSSLRDWCREGGKVAVVSKDAGVKAACCDSPDLVHFSTIESFYELLNSSDVRAAISRETILRLKSRVLELAREQLESLSFFVAGHEGEVDSAEVRSVEFEGEDIEVLSVDELSSTALVEVTLEYMAEISYPVPGSGAYDREDGLLLFQDMITETVERRSRIELAVELDFEGGADGLAEVSGVVVAGPDAILVETSYDKEYPFK